MVTVGQNRLITTKF